MMTMLLSRGMHRIRSQERQERQLFGRSSNELSADSFHGCRITAW